MKKITQIQISNYRAFYNEMPNKSYINEDIPTNDNIVKLKNGENVLIYGENGSGKSSLFHALKDFFESASTGNVNFATHLNIFAKGKPDFPISQVSVYFNNFEGTPATIEEKDPNEPIVLSANPTTTKAENDFLKEASQAFLSYRDMLKTYFLDDEKSGSPDLFDLFINRFLGKNALSDGTTIKYNLDSIELKLQTLNIAIQDLINDGIDKEDAKETLISPILTKIKDFNEMLYTTLEPVIHKINQFLKNKEHGGYFNANFEITLPKNYPFLILDGENLKQSLKFKIKYFEQDINDTSYHHFLNEARLSALAICIYLVAIKKNTPTADKYKILFLDDIFIGLDMSNRLPLLEILKNEFSDYQIFITTYDRSWFEVAKDNLGNNWQKIEMYVGKNAAGFDVPVIISDNLEPLEKAEAYFKAFDYYAAGNYLRRTVEKLLEKLLPVTYRASVDDLNGMIDMLSKYYDECGCEDLLVDETRNMIKNFKNIVFNPASHYDLRSPLYKAEIEEAINFVKVLQSLSVVTRQLLIGMKSYLFYSNTALDYKATFKLSENVYAVFCNSIFRNITDAKHTLVEFTYKGDTKNPNTEHKFSERSGRIQRYLTLPEPLNYTDVFYNSEGKSLQNLIDEL